MTTYHSDFYGWTQEQASLLRAGRWPEIDIENLIEEIETMGRSEKRALQSRLTVLLTHLLKWRYQPQRRGRSWLLTLKGQRLAFNEILDDNPGLKPQLSTLLANAYEMAKLHAAKETRLDDNIFEHQCPWTLAQIADPGFFPD